jgi:hypothetical protein
MNESQTDETTPIGKRDLKTVSGYAHTQEEDTIQWNESKTVRRVAEFDSPDQLLDESPPGDVRRPLLPIEKNPNLVSQISILKDTTAHFPGIVKSRKRQRREVSIMAKLKEKNFNNIFTPRLQNKDKPRKSTPLAISGTSDFDDILKQIKTPSPESSNVPSNNPSSDAISSCRSPNATAGDASDDFDEFNFSVDDIEAIDSLVSKATQPASFCASKEILSQPSDKTATISNSRFSPAIAGANTRHHNLPRSNVSVPAHQTIATNRQPVHPFRDENQSSHMVAPLAAAIPDNNKSSSPPQDTDLFGEFPDIDFDAMDDFIMQAQSQPDNALAALHHDIEILAKKQAATMSVKPQNPGFLVFSRYKVVNVSKDQPRGDFTLILSVAAWKEDMLHWNPRQIHKADSDGLFRVRDEPLWPADGLIYLKGEWYQTDVVPGDIIHVCSLTGNRKTDVSALPLTLSTMDVLDDMVVVLHPDLLLTPTTISEAVACTRRAVLKDRLGSTGISGKQRCFCFGAQAFFE